MPKQGLQDWSSVGEPVADWSSVGAPVGKVAVKATEQKDWSAVGSPVSAPAPNVVETAPVATPSIKPEKGGIIDFFKDVGGAVGSLPLQTRATIEQATLGNDPRAVAASPIQKEMRASSERDAIGQNKEYWLGLTSRDIKSGIQSLPFSLGSLGAYLVASAPARAIGTVAGTALGPAGSAAGAIAGTIAGAGAGMAASAKAGYNMDVASVLNNLYSVSNTEFRKKTGRDMTPDEFGQFADNLEVQKEIFKHGAAEAGLEATANLITSTAFGKFLKPVVAKLIAKPLEAGAAKQIGKFGAAKAIGLSMAGELATETPTHLIQSQAEAALGLTNQPPPSALSPADWAESFKQVVWPTLITTGVIGGGVKAASIPLNVYGNKVMADRINRFVADGGISVLDDKQLGILQEQAETVHKARKKDESLPTVIETIKQEIDRRKAGQQGPKTGLDLSGLSTNDLDAESARAADGLAATGPAVSAAQPAAPQAGPESPLTRAAQAGGLQTSEIITPTAKYPGYLEVVSPEEITVQGGVSPERADYLAGSSVKDQIARLRSVTQAAKAQRGPLAQAAARGPAYIPPASAPTSAAVATAKTAPLGGVPEEIGQPVELPAKASQTARILSLPMARIIAKQQTKSTGTPYSVAAHPTEQGKFTVVAGQPVEKTEESSTSPISPLGSPISLQDTQEEQGSGSVPPTGITSPETELTSAIPGTENTAQIGQVPPAIQNVPPPQAPETSELQPRDRERLASVAQMNAIAAKPDYGRLGQSRSPESGAPLAFANADQANIPPDRLGKEETAVLSDGRRVPFRYAVVEADTVQPSNFADGRPNPEHASTEPGIIRALNNGRVAGVRAAYSRGTTADYVEGMVADKAAHGILEEAVRGLKQPMLIRLYSEADNTADIGAKSQGATLGMSATEQAISDAKLLTDEVLAQHRPGDITSSVNRDFVRSFTNKIGDLSSLLDAEGNLSQPGRKRIEAALMVAAYSDANIVSELFESTDNDIKAIGDALRETAGLWATMRDLARAGAIDPQVDLTGNLMAAVQLIRKARAEGKSVSSIAGQGDLMSGTFIDPFTEGFLRIFYRGKDFTRARSKDAVISGLVSYTEGAGATRLEAGLFGEADRVTPADILKSVTEKLDGKDTAPAQGDLLAASRRPDGEVAASSRKEGQRSVGPSGGKQVAEQVRDKKQEVAKPADKVATEKKKKEPFTFAVKPQGDGFILESDNGGGVVVEKGQHLPSVLGGSKVRQFKTAKEAELYAKNKGMALHGKNLTPVQTETDKALPPELSLKLRSLAKITENARQAIRKFDPKTKAGEYQHVSRARATTRHANASMAAELWDQKKQGLGKALREAAKQGYAIPQEYIDLAGSAFDYENGKYSPVKADAAPQAKPETSSAPAEKPATKAEKAAETKPDEYVVNSPVAEYPIREDEDRYQKDLLGNRLPDKDRKRPKTPVHRDVHSTASVRSLDVKDKSTGTFAVETALISERSRTIPVDRISTVDEAATAFAYLYDYAVEHFDALVTDKNGKPLAVVGSFKGTLSSAAVYPSVIVHEAFRIKGAANVWLSHNHPSGVSDLSRADETLHDRIVPYFRGSKIKLNGLFAIGSNGYTFRDNNGNTTTGAIKKPEQGTGSEVPVVERVFTKNERLGDIVTGGESAKAIIPAISNGQAGLVLLDTIHRPVAFVSVTKEEAGMLRTRGRMDRLYRAMSKANAAAAIIANPNDTYNSGEQRNLAGFVNSQDARALDIIRYNYNHETSEVSDVKSSEPSSETAFFSRPGRVQTETPETKPSGVAPGKARSMLVSTFGETAIRNLEKNGILKIVQNQYGIPEELRSRVRGDEEGLYANGTGYLIADNLSEGRVVPTLLHEIGEHYGLEKMLGEKSHKSLMVRIRMMRGTPRVKEAWAFVKSEYSHLDENSTPFLHEVLAKLGEYADVRSKPWYTKVVQAIRLFLLKLGFTKHVSGEHIGELLVASLRKAATGESVAFAPAGSEVMASEKAGTWYSQLLRAVDSAKQTSMPAAQWKLWLKANQAKLEVKQDEIDWVGMNEFLDEQKGSVTKGALLSFIRSNQVEVREVTLADKTYFTVAEIKKKINDGERIDVLDGEYQVPYDELDNYLDDATLSVKSDSGDTKFASYQLPGGESYKELLLTLPEKARDTSGYTAELVSGPDDMGLGEWQVMNGDRFVGNQIASYTRENAIQTAASRENREKPTGFKSPHFYEPNVLAHVRFNERVDADGRKVLFIEEVQSDMHQKGRKEGYVPKPRWTLKEETGETFEVYGTREAAVRDQLIEANNGHPLAIVEGTAKTSGVPDAPFKTTWPLLAMKRMIRFAAENGFDRIAWITGGQTVTRYKEALQKVADRIEWTKTSEGVHIIGYKNGTKTADTTEKENDVSDAIGKFMADKIKADPNQSGVIDGDDITISSTWPVKFYDQMLPSMVNKYVKKWDSRVVLQEDSRWITLPDSRSIEKYAGLSLDPVDRGMGAATEDGKILKAVVSALPVDVVDVLRVNGVSPEDFSRNPQMFADRLSVDVSTTVSDGLRNALAETRTRLRAGLDAAHKAGLDAKIIPTLNASDINTDVAAGIMFPELFDIRQGAGRADIGVSLGGTGAGAEAGSGPVALGGREGVPAGFADFIKWHRGISQRGGDVIMPESWQINITPAMRESVMQGQASFSRSKSTDQVQPNAPVPSDERLQPVKDWAEKEIDKKIYNYVDWFMDLRRIQGRVGAVPESQDASLAEERYAGSVRARVKDFRDDLRSPLVKAIQDSGQSQEQVERYLHARHAPEGNAAMREINPTATELDALRGLGTTERGRLTENADVQEYLAQRRNMRAVQEEIDDGPGDESDAEVIQGEIDRLQRIPEVREYVKVSDRLRALKNIEPFEGDNTALSGMSDKDAAGIIAKARKDGTADVLESISGMVDAITDKTRGIYRDEGLMTPEAVGAMEAKYKHYVPLHRDEVSAGPSIGQGYNIRGQEVKRRTGSTKEVTNILAHVLAQHEAAIIRAEKSRVDRALFEFAKAHPDENLWTLDQADTIRTVDPVTGTTVDRVDPLYKNKPNVLTLKIEGEEHTITFNESNPEAVRLASSMKNLSSAELGEVTRLVGVWTRWLATMNTSANPVFVAGNFLRDLGTAYINLSDTELAGMKKDVFRDIPKAIRGFWNMSRGDMKSEWAKHAREFRDSGGAMGWTEQYKDIGERADKLSKMLKRKENTAWNLTKEMASEWWNLIEDANGAVENGVRLSSFVNARRAGLSVGKSMSIAKNLTVNFDRRGAKSVELNMWYMFARASINGSARIVKALGNKNVQKIIGYVIASGFLMDVLARAMAGDGDDDGENDYDQLPEHAKATKFIFWVGRPITIPMPYGYNFFASVGRKMSETMFRKNYSPVRGAADLANVFVNAFNPLGNVSSLTQFAAPTILDPFIQWAENKNFAGYPLRKEQMPFGPKRPEYQMGLKSTSAPAKWLSEVLNNMTGGNEVRPGAFNLNSGAIDFAISSVAGGAGRTYLQAFNLPIKLLTGQEVQAREVPFANIAFGSKPEYQTQRLFYEHLRSVELAQSEYKRYLSDTDMTRKIREDHGAEIRMIGYARLTSLMLNKLREREKLIEQSKAADKNEVLKQMDARRQEIMRSFNKRYNEARQ